MSDNLSNLQSTPVAQAMPDQNIPVSNPNPAPEHIQGPPPDFMRQQYGHLAPPQCPYPPETMAGAKNSKLKQMLKSECRDPLLVAVLVIILSLPSVYQTVGGYIPKVLDSTKNLTNTGIFGRAVLVAVMFYLAKRVL